MKFAISFFALLIIILGHIFDTSLVFAQVSNIPETSLTLVPDKMTYQVGEVITLKIYARSETDYTNLFVSKLNFSPDLLEVTNMTIYSEGPGQTVALPFVPPSPTPIPTTTPSPTSEPTPAPLPFYTCNSQNIPNINGDLNNDGVTNFSDMNLVLTNFNKSGENLLGDLSKDGKVDNFDMTCLRSVLVYKDIIKTTPNAQKPFITQEATTSGFTRISFEEWFDNTEGKIVIVRGRAPAFKSKFGTNPLLAAITFRAKAKGYAWISFDPSTVMFSNLEYGTNLLQATRNKIVPIKTSISQEPAIPEINLSGLSLKDTDPWEKRAVWWNTDWRFRIPVDITATTDIRDGFFSFEWQKPENLDENSLRLIEYTPNGHIIPNYAPKTGELGINRFTQSPVSLQGNQVIAMIPNLTTNGQTRRFFLYYDTQDHPKAQKDYHYLIATGSANIQIDRVGPDTETTFKKTSTIYQSNPFEIKGGADIDLALLQGNNCAGSLITDAQLNNNALNPLIRITGSVSGNAGSCATVSGTLKVDVNHMLIPTIYHSAQISKGEITLTPGSDINLNNNTLDIFQATVNNNSDSWYADLGSANKKLTTPTGIIIGKGSQMGIRADSKTTVLRLDDYLLPENVTVNSWKVQKPNGQIVKFTAQLDNGIWKKDTPLKINFTILLGTTGIPDVYLIPLMNSQAPQVSVGNPIEFSQDLLEGQFAYYEEKAWDYVENKLSKTGWDKPWNITYGFNTESNQFTFAHDWDSSMGAGFLLYAASLKATMTGEERYYKIADAYANYFLQLEAEDIFEHGDVARGRISYGYNGSDSDIKVNYCDTPPHSVAPCSSSDQMTTSAMGLWQYFHLNEDKIQYKEPVKQLLFRMAQREQVSANNLQDPAILAFMNIPKMMNLYSGGWAWYYPVPAYINQGSYYTNWLKGLTTDLNTGAGANLFYNSNFLDSLKINKDPVSFMKRYVGISNDTGTNTKGFYPLIRGVSYQSAWGYTDEEFPKVGMLLSGPKNLISQSADPKTYQLLSGGARDGISGRMTEQAAVTAYAAMENPQGMMQVMGDNGPKYFDYSRDAIHTVIALLMDDQSAIRDAALGGLGRASLKTHIQTADFSGYYLLLMNYYHLLRKDVPKIMPLNGYYYMHGLAEKDNKLIINYLGDTTFNQDFIFPTQDPVFTTGVITSPIMRFDSTGKILEFEGKIFPLFINLPYSVFTSATIRQVPMSIIPDSGIVKARIISWDTNSAKISLEASSDQNIQIKIKVSGSEDAIFNVVGNNTNQVLDFNW